MSDAHNQRLQAIRGSYKAQQLLAAEEADDFLEKVRHNTNANITLLYFYVYEAFRNAVDLAKMTRDKNPTSVGQFNVEQFVAHQVRLFECIKRIKDYPNIAEIIENWPKNPGITFAVESGSSALEVAIHFAEVIHNGVLFARGEIAFHGITSYDNLLVCPNSDPAFEKWRNRTVEELLARELPKPDIWPNMSDIHREYRSLLYKLEDEYKKAMNNDNQKMKENIKTNGKDKSEKNTNSAFIKAGGNITAGGNIIINNQIDSSNKLKLNSDNRNPIIREKWYHNRTIQGSLIGAVVLILISVFGWYIQYTSQKPNIFADVTKDGIILKSKNFPWEIRKTKNEEGNILYTLVDRGGDATAISVIPDNPKYTVYQSYDGMVIKYTCSEEKIPNFRIIIKY